MTPLRQEDVWDYERERQFQADIERALYQLSIWLLGNAGAEILTDRLIRWFHREVFESVFPDVAGVVRGAAVPFDVSFGRHRGSPHSECQADFIALCDEAQVWIGSLDQLPRGQAHEHALEVACTHHATRLAWRRRALHLPRRQADRARAPRRPV